MSSLLYSDLSYLNEFSGNDESFVIGMVQTFLDNSPSELTNLKRALVENDYSQIKQIVHKLKSSIGFLGIKNIMDIVKETEDLAVQAQNMPLIQTNCRQIIMICELAGAELRAHFKL